MNILLVDDDIVDRKHVQRTLEKSDLTFSITEAETVNEGLLFFKKYIYDIILLDYRMPERDGIEMVSELRSKPHEFSTAIVMMSNCDDEDLGLRCIKNGSQDFLVKSEITATLLRKAILHAQIRVEIEKKLFTSYQKVKQLAETDFLTGLPNRYIFDESLKMAVFNNRRESFKIALLLIDLDNFKYVNDTFGHDVGDVLLKKTVMRIKGCLRGHELFARLGGDEFAIMLCDLQSVENVTAAVRRIIHVMMKPFDIENGTFVSSASIGVSIHPDNGLTGEALFKQADIAMYRAKSLGRNRACFFEEEMQATFSYRIKMEQELILAEEKQQFELYFQPVINPRDKELVGFEALLRWNADNGIRKPGDFVVIAEETRQILSIGKWVIDKAISTLALWNEANNSSYYMSINISTVQLSDSELSEIIKNCLDKYQVDASLIELELTETALFTDSKKAKNTLFELHKMGCKISLDDFGTGFSSISHLKNYPIDTIKIDKSLMSCTEYYSPRGTLVKGIVAMADTLGVGVVAEGIETAKHVELCISLGIKRVQGFFYSKPLDRLRIEKHYLFK